MESYHIRGGKKLFGELQCSGAKNSALPILAATVLTKGENVLEDCPDILDVENMLEILRSIGCRVKREGTAVYVDASGADDCRIPERLVSGMRSSVFLMGPLLARCGQVVMSKPGGCEIGKRPIDIHVNGLRQLGVHIVEDENLVICSAGHMKSCSISLPFPSVGATENIMLAAVGARGVTRIHNCAREPEIVDLQHFLQGCGVRVYGAGTESIYICGQKNATACQHRIIPDRIEAGTFLAAVAASGGELLIRNISQEHVEAMCEILKAAGCQVKAVDDGIFLKSNSRLNAVEGIATGPYPAFPTDMQSQLLAAMTVAYGTSTIEENIFENRFRFVKWLQSMGADIELCNRKAIVRGVEQLEGGVVEANDLRGGAALIIAGLAAHGITRVEHAFHIDRGYETIDLKLRKLGADIRTEHRQME